LDPNIEPQKHIANRRKNFVSPSDILTVAFRVLRHRIELSYEAKAKGLSCDEVLKEIFDRVKIP